MVAGREGSAVASVVVVDDHRTFGDLLGMAVDAEPDFAFAGQATTGATGIALIESREPDIAVVDVRLPDMEGFEVARRATSTLPELRVVMLTAHASADYVARAAEAGACAYLPKDGELTVLLSTLRTAYRGGMVIHPALATRLARPEPDGRARVGLTPRETEVLELMGRGHDVRTISRLLGVTEHTCRGYVKRVLAELGAHSQLEAVVLAVRRGLLEVPRDG